MTPMTTVKIALALIAAVLFALGVRTEIAALRWAAIGFLFVAVLLRFVGRAEKQP